MISAAEFKKQITPTLRPLLRQVGFKGSGFSYRMESEDFIFMIGIQASNWGSRCYVEVGIHPKELMSINGEKLDLKKLKYYDCEFRARLDKNKEKEYWDYSEDLQTNERTAVSIFNTIKEQAIPLIQLFLDNPHFLEEVIPFDFNHTFKNVSPKLGNLFLLTGGIRFAWALATFLEKKNPVRARLYAEYGMSKLGEDNNFMGSRDFERVLSN